MVYKIKKHIPESEALVERDRKVIATCQHLSSYPFVIDRARGEMLTDVDGNEYIDFDDLKYRATGNEFLKISDEEEVPFE